MYGTRKLATWRFLAAFIAMTLIVLCSQPAHTPMAQAAPAAPLLVDTGSTFPGLTLGTSAWGDYDNDGRPDLFLTGADSNTKPLTRLYHNTAAGLVDVTEAMLGADWPNLAHSSIAWGDYDNDGRLDFILTGQDGTGAPFSFLFHNNNGTKFVVDNTALPDLAQLGYGAAAWGDYDADGKLDLLTCGLTATTTLACYLYHNDGGARFSDVTATALPQGTGLGAGTVAWGDYDNDGWLDLLLSGARPGNTAGSTVLLHNRRGTFEDITASALPGAPALSYSTGAWGDYDNDGWLDLVLAGIGNYGSQAVGRLYHNNRDGTLRDVSASQLPTASREKMLAPALWGDYDNDGKLDLFIAGLTPGSSWLLRNTGAGFSAVTSTAAPGLGGVTLGLGGWADYDNDGKLDLFFAGHANSSGDLMAWLFHNVGPRANTAPAAPTALAVSVTDDGATLSWRAPADDLTPAGGLSYNLRVGTTPGGSDVVGPMASAAGLRRLPAAGSIQGASWTLRNLNAGQTYYWSVQAVDSAFQGGAFAAQASFTVPARFSAATTPLPNVWRGIVAPADYNGDGRTDLLIAGQNSAGNPVSRLYRNSSSGFTDVTSAAFPGGLVPVYSGAAAWQDYNGDGRPDLLLSGSGSGTNITRLYHNNGTTFTDVTTTTLPGLPGLSNSAIAWGDYDSDGKPDLFIGGQNGDLKSFIYHNDGVAFRNVTTTTIDALPGISYGAAAWGDADNDGKLDLIISGANYDQVLYYHNTGLQNGATTFNEETYIFFNQPPPHLTAGTVQWLDLNGDNMLDLFMTGYETTRNMPTSTVYINTGFDMVDQTRAYFPGGVAGVYQGSAAWADYDGDGRPDLLLGGSGADSSRPLSRLYHNNGDLTLSDLTGSAQPRLSGAGSAAVAWFDANADGKPDILLTGSANNITAGAKTALYLNNSPGFTFAPSGLIGNQLALASGTQNWGDFDGDGRLDLFTTGLAPNGVALMRLLRYSGSTFTDVSATAFGLVPGLYQSAAAWGDYDRDGRLDLVVSGYSGAARTSKLYHNKGGVFEDKTALLPALPQADEGAVAWGDYDNDGKLDLLFSGATAGGPVSKLYRNTGSAFADVTAVVVPGLPGLSNGSITWADYDRDGRLDFLISGANAKGSAVSRLYHNGGATFSDVTAAQFAAGLPAVQAGAAAWGDYDNDGRLDLLFSGETSAWPVSKLYHNTAGGFADVTAAQFAGHALPNIRAGAISWGDYDNDGKLDFILAGGDAGDSSTRVLYRNTGSGFGDVTAAAMPGGLLPPTLDGGGTWADYNKDGKLDLLLTGSDGGSNTAISLFKNSTPLTNTLPAAPLSLHATIFGTTATLSWAAPADAQTPANGLSYNLRVGTIPGGSDVVGPMANAAGAVQSLSWKLNGLQTQQTYYWSVQAVDGALAGGPFAAEASFTLAATNYYPISWTSAVSVTASANTLIKTGAPGWNAGAVSSKSISSGDGSVQITVVDTSTFAYFGLSHGNSNQTSQDIDFALYTYGTSNTLYVYEAGVSRASFAGYNVGDVLRVAVEGGKVKYYRNNTLLYSSAAKPTYPLLVDTSLYTAGGRIANAFLYLPGSAVKADR